jgi:hypothetical protein
MTWAHRADVRGVAEGRTFARDRQRPRLRAFIRALGAGAQTFEDEVRDALAAHRLATAEGAALDLWGGWVNEPRAGFGDAAYRRIIYARILANTSDGGLITLRDIAAYMFDVPVTDVRVIEIPPAKLEVRVLIDTPVPSTLRERAAVLLKNAAPMGVGLSLFTLTLTSALFDVAGVGFDEGEFS